MAVAAAFTALPVFAQPSGAHAIHGAASLSQQGNKLVVTTQNGAGTAHSAVNWQSFSVPAGTVTQFNQPSAASTSINRVVGSNPSAIFGTLSSNGRLVLVNPAGIAVGAGAVVDTAGFTASTLRMSDADALAGRLRFEGGTNALTVGGQILARNGDVVLLAPNVETAATALVHSPNGATILAAGQKAELTGRGLEGIKLEVQAPENKALNLGTLTGDAVGIFAGSLKHSGLIRATALTAEGGRVVLKGQEQADIGGAVQASQGDKGGSVHATANKVMLRSGAVIDVSGPVGGGEALLGGGWQGKDDRVANARSTTLEAGSVIHADAFVSGNGGTVVAWADDSTRGLGAVTARGGTQGGDGGTVEVSGKRRLAFDAVVDTSATKGRLGTLLLDPDSITVTTAPPSTPLGDVDQFTDPAGSFNVSPALINAQTANVVLQANENISIEAPINITNSGTSFTAQAGRFINVQAGNTITTNGGDITLLAGAVGASPAPSESSLSVNAAVTSNGGKITLDSRLSDVGGNSLQVNANLNAGAGLIELKGQQVEIAVGANVSRSGTGDLTFKSNKVDVQGSLTSGAGGRVVFMPQLSSHAITLGGTDENAALNLTNAELNNVTASVLVLGSGTHTGGISVAGTINLVNTPSVGSPGTELEFAL